ncbi:hypothetical protein FAI41_04820 [Acetobacteraceae bacterium]|nr:hypothetical protein FAI41_04820 [Acetobacteraceae bacterium]
MKIYSPSLFSFLFCAGMRFFSFFSFLQSLFLRWSAIGFAALSLSACHSICVMPNDLYQGLNELYASRNNIAQVNQSLGEKEGVPKAIQKIQLIGPINFERLEESGVTLAPEPQANSRYVTLVFRDKTKAEGVLNEERLNERGAAILTRWIPAQQIAQSLKIRDSHQFSTQYGLKQAHPDFNNVKIQVCVGRMTAQGFQESFPFEAWSYCANPKTKKSLNKFHNVFLGDLKKIFYDPIYIFLDAS